jgi:hypothetical protein
MQFKLSLCAFSCKVMEQGSEINIDKNGNYPAATGTPQLCRVESMVREGHDSD